MAITITHYDDVIDITSPQDSLDIQDLVNSIREEEASERGIVHDQILAASGKDELATGVAVGITANLLGSWQLRFWVGSYMALISGGNLAMRSGSLPIAYSAGVHINILESANATLVTPEIAGWSEAEKTDLLDKVGRLLGLNFENTYRHTIVYDIEGRVSSELLDHYDSKTNTELHDGSTGFLNQWSVTYSYDGSGNLNGISYVKES